MVCFLNECDRVDREDTRNGYTLFLILFSFFPFFYSFFLNLAINFIRGKRRYQEDCLENENGLVDSFQRRHVCRACKLSFAYRVHLR